MATPISVTLAPSQIGRLDRLHAELVRGKVLVKPLTREQLVVVVLDQGFDELERMALERTARERPAPAPTGD